MLIIAMEDYLEPGKMTYMRLYNWLFSLDKKQKLLGTSQQSIILCIWHIAGRWPIDKLNKWVLSLGKQWLWIWWLELSNGLTPIVSLGTCYLQSLLEWAKIKKVCQMFKRLWEISSSLCRLSPKPKMRSCSLWSPVLYSVFVIECYM